MHGRNFNPFRRVHENGSFYMGLPGVDRLSDGDSNGTDKETEAEEFFSCYR